MPLPPPPTELRPLRGVTQTTWCWTAGCTPWRATTLHGTTPPSLPSPLDVVAPTPPFVQATPMSKQHWALLPSIFAAWILGVHFPLVLLCAMCATRVLRCMMFIFCVKEADLGMRAFVAYLAPWFSEWYTMSFRMYHAQCNASATPLCKQHYALVPSISGHLLLLEQGVRGTRLFSIIANVAHHLC